MTMAMVALVSGFKEGPDYVKCTNWSRTYDGVQFRYCQSGEYISYYDNLEWYNGNSYRVYISWEWSFDSSKGQSAIYLGSGETSDPAAIPDGYEVLSIKVERK